MYRNIINIISNNNNTVISNLISLMVTIIILLIVPKLIGPDEYSYWQLYLFYSSYVGFMHLGWNDGIYLRYGGEQYSTLNKELFFSQFHMLIILQIFIGIITAIITFRFVIDSDRSFILFMVTLCMILTNIRLMLIYILQATNKIKEYINISIIGRVLYALLIIFSLLNGFRDYRVIIFADIIGRTISLSYAVYCCRDIVFRNISTFYFSYKETWKNISVGIQLMIASISSMLIIGVVRFGIEYYWGVLTFGKISLTLSMSNLMLLFVNSIGIIIFPLLRRTNQENLSKLYVIIRDLLMVIVLGIFIIYYPLKEILSIWLPKYSESLIYMALLFPIVLYEGKMALLINTYLKNFRKESLILIINLCCLFISIISTIIISTFIKDLSVLTVSIVFHLGLRCIIAELWLARILQVSVLRDISLEFILTIVFILTSWFINSWISVLIYGLGYILYIMIKRTELIKTFNSIGELIQR